MDFRRYFGELSPISVPQKGKKHQIQANSEDSDLRPVNVGLLYPKRTNVFTESE